MSVGPNASITIHEGTPVTASASIRKIADIPRSCNHPEHNPPNMIVLSPGVYEHTCPGCGQKTQWTEYGGPQC